MISSTSRGEIFSPPRLMISLRRPVMRDVAVVVHRALVAGAEPAVVERVGVGLRIVLVRRHHVRPSDDDLAGVAARHRRARRRRRCESPGPPLGPTVPGLRAPGGSGLLAIWCAASVMPYASTTGTPNTRSSSRDHRRRQRGRRRADEPQPMVLHDRRRCPARAAGSPGASSARRCTTSASPRRPTRRT